MGTNTGIGIGIGIPFRNNALGGDNIYFPPELKARMIGVWDNYGKKNTDADRNIIKNKIPNAGGDLEILNAAYKLNSGFGEYKFDFERWALTKPPTTCKKYNDSFNITYVGRPVSEGECIVETGNNSDSDIQVYFKVEISGIEDDMEGWFNTANFRNRQQLYNGINIINVTVNSKHWYGFDFIRTDRTALGNCNILVKQIPEFEGALVTDGINDIIASIKTLDDWNVGDKGITIISMIHQISTSKSITTTNNLRNEGRVVGRNIVNNTDKTGIYGWYKEDLQGTTATLISDILGDKNDYTGHYTENTNPITNSKFYVQGYAIENGFTELSSVAHYWTFAVLGKATEDEINLIIAKYNLDRTLKPNILCNTIKQGITNENHAEFGDKLIDFSGNGRDIQLNNIAWDGDSGIGKYNYPNWKVTATIANTYSTIVNYPTVNGTYSINVNGVSELMQSIGLHLEIKYTTSTGIIYIDIKQDGVYSYILPDGATDLTLRFGGIPGIVNEPCNITITQIPSHAGALCLNGINDFGQFVGDLGLKDYTFIADRAYSRIAPSQVPFIASTQTNGQAPFLMEYLNEDTYVYPHSFGTTTKTINLNIQRQISYQSTYVYNGNSISKGISVDTGDGFTIGNSGSTGAQYSPLCLWSLMLFPYSMSEFLIERQLKKHKLGTLYPNMMEFRPIIKSNIDTLKINYWDKDWNVVNVGDYVSVGNDIKTNITVPNGYKVSKVTSDAFDNITIEKSSTDFIYDVKFYGIKKSPQKITMTIEQDENYVKFEPVITSNVEYVRLDFYLNNYQKRINIGDYIPKGAYLRANFYLKNNVDELTAFIFNGVNIGYRRSSVDDTAFNISHIYNYDSPQEVNITIDEYIRYEDIVQPYPVLLRFNDESGKEVSWGGKFRVGSTITRIGSAADSNLLPNIYNIFGLLLNDNQVTSSKVIVEKTMVFKAKSAYIFDNNEPKCILSPSRLRIPNSSYKLLGYIPDISGHGNHGVIHNSAYAEGSGVNEDGSYQFDGVDDFVTIPTITGGKQVLMKVNWQSIAGTAILYDQRTNGGFAIFNRDFDTNENKVPAYRARNIGGSTYIDGILNEYIYASELKDITHNIVELCDPKLNTGTLNPKIGSSYLNSNYAQMSLYDFMLFDEISTDDKIKELNEYVGIEAKVELPPYYWDAYGKTNLDADKATIQQRGVAEGDYDITNYNHAYDKMSGYGGYEFAKFYNTSEWNLIRNSTGIEVVSRNGYSCTLKRVGSNVWDFGNSSNRKIGKDLNVNIKCDKNIKIKWQLKYKTTENPDTEITVELVNDSIGPNPKSITLPHKTDEELTTLGAIESSVYYLVYFDSSTLPIGEEYTVEMLPLYTNGLVYDGITDYSENVNVPAFTEFSYVFKRKLLSESTGSASMNKGLTDQQRAVVVDHINANGNIEGTSFGTVIPVSSLRDSDIIYSTTNNINGTTITKGNNPDSNGIDIGKFATYYKKIVFYKLILYPKTIPLLQINFLKNLMERDEIIDLDNPIFKK